MQTYWDAALGYWVTRNADGSTRRATHQEVLAQGTANTQPAASTPPTGGNQPLEWTDPATGKVYYLSTGEYYDINGVKYGTPSQPSMVPGPVSDGTPPPPAAVSKVPTYTPGMQFGAGVIPGQTPGQYEWFDRGAAGKENTNDIYWNQNFENAWQQAVEKLGGMPGSPYANFLKGWMGTAKTDWNNTATYNPNINASDFIDDYAPQVKSVYDLLSPQGRGIGGRLFTAGRATY